MALSYQDMLTRYASPARQVCPQEIRALLLERRIRIVVIDDDPTGIQTVHGCLFLTEPNVAHITEALQDEEPFFYLLVNSRAMTEEDARKVVRQAVEAVLEANRTLHYNLLFISRSDSTLRGHFPAEPDTIRTVLAEQHLEPCFPLLFIPSFFEAGRMTIEGVHYMRNNEELIPVNETEFARDNVFGYQNARLTEYIVEKGRGTIRTEELMHITLTELRSTTPEAIASRLQQHAAARCISFDSLDYGDLGVLAKAILLQFTPDKQEQYGIIRSSSSLPKALSGIEEQGYVAAPTKGAQGVVVVGSHVKKSTEQLLALLASPHVAGIEIDVEAILNDDPTLMQRTMQQAQTHYNAGIIPVLYTSRKEVRCNDVAQRQALGIKISQFLVEAVRSLPFHPDFLVSKGGITSHDILTHSLAVRMARVEGQAAAGIPTIRTDSKGPFPQMRYVIFPGNVGAVETLREVVERLRA